MRNLDLLIAENMSMNIYEATSKSEYIDACKKAVATINEECKQEYLECLKAILHTDDPYRRAEGILILKDLNPADEKIRMACGNTVLEWYKQEPIGDLVKPLEEVMTGLGMARS